MSKKKKSQIRVTPRKIDKSTRRGQRKSSKIIRAAHLENDAMASRSSAELDKGMNIPPMERFVRAELVSTDGEGYTILIDVILDTNDRLVGKWPYFGLWANVADRRRNARNCWPIVLEPDGSINCGEDNDYFESSLRRGPLRIDDRIVLRDPNESGKRINDGYAFRVSRISELIRRPSRD